MEAVPIKALVFFDPLHQLRRQAGDKAEMVKIERLKRLNPCPIHRFSEPAAQMVVKEPRSALFAVKIVNAWGVF